jgi:tRNA pseudouridine55 synthase
MEALRRVKRITGQRSKVGHGGTMDPLARGVLPVCLGQATRLMDYVVGGRKKYRMEVKLGETTSTFDGEGDVVKTKEVTGVTRETVEQALQSFVGLIDQKPPMYSAIKVQGQRLYKLARAGIEVERKPRPVEIYDIRVVECSPPILLLDVESGRGAYMRSLANDLGEALDCGGHVSDLIRNACGGFDQEESVTLEELETAASEPDGWERFLHPIDWVLRDLKSISVGSQAEEYLRHGKPISLGGPFVDAGYAEPFRAYSNEGHFLALVRFDRPGNAWRPVKVFRSDSPSPFAPVSPQT